MPLDDKKEQFYWVDENDNVLGIITRYEAHSGSMKIHRSIGIFIENANEELLLQQRSLHKDVDPGKWSYSVAGHVTTNQSYKEAAIREAAEEMGIELVNLKYLGKYLIVTNREREITAFYSAQIDNTNITVDKTEIERCLWIKKINLPNFARNNTFTSWSLEAFKLNRMIT